MFSLAGKNALVTGGGAVGSMGHGVAECLASQGANVCLVDLGADPFAAVKSTSTPSHHNLIYRDVSERLRVVVGPQRPRAVADGRRGSVGRSAG